MKDIKFAGTCKDMCPEKERYLRTARLQVSQFETSEDRSAMDHNFAIKQYSRSAADAEIPLPQDLRPESTLKLTMNYLLHFIMNLCEDDNYEVGEWFHFVWDRTRGIRKDITMQELCSPVCAELVEQCVRFHIHCAHRLVDQPPGQFDQKINTENLTKCLQTLKYMYDDLKEKNIECPNEAEFRAYVILLNLNDSGNFLWEIKQLNRDTLGSSEIRFALDAYFAISHNNYVKFFDLVRGSTYLTACILMRYFTQVRMKALQTIMTSYTATKKIVLNYSISYLERILYFESYEATINFLTHHGLECNEEEDSVALDRLTFGAAETPFVMERCRQTIESKQEGEVAEIICGGALPSPDSFLDHMPHSSFDQNGLFKRESMLAEDQNGSETFGSAFIFEAPKTSPSLAAAKTKTRPMESFGAAPADAAATPSLFKPPTTAFASQSAFGSAKTSSFGAAAANAKTNIFATPKPSTFGSAAAAKTNVFSAPQSELFASPKNIFGSSSSQSSSFGAAIPSLANSPFIRADKNNEPTSWNSPRPATNIFGSSKNDTETPNIFHQSSTGAFFTPQHVDNSSLIALGDKKRQEPAWSSMSSMSAQKAASREILEVELKMKEAEEKAKQEKLRAAEEEARKKAELQQQREKEEEEKRQQQEAIEAKRQEERKKFDEQCQQILNEIVDDIVYDEVTASAKSAIHLYVEIPEGFYDALEHDVAVLETYKIYQQELHAYVNTMNRRYEILQRFFRHWRIAAAAEKIRKAKLSSIGCVALNRSLEENAHELQHTQQRESMWKINQYVLGRPLTVEWPNASNELKIDLFEHLQLDFDARKVNVFWKLLVSLPHKGEEGSVGFSNYIRNWFMNIMNYQKDERVFIKQHQIGINQVNVCMRALLGKELVDEHGSAVSEASETLKNSNGIIFIASFGNLNLSRKRLQNILDKLDYPTPVSMLFYNSRAYPSGAEDIEEIFNLSREPRVADYQINIHNESQKRETDLRENLLISFQSLFDYHKHCSSALDNLRMQHIIEFLNITMGDEMWKRIELSVRENEIVRQQFQRLDDFIELHNFLVDKAISLIKKPEDLPPIADEFRAQLSIVDARIHQTYEHFPADWRTESFRKRQIEFVKSLKLKSANNQPEFHSLDAFKQQLSSFLHENLREQHDRIFHVVLSQVHDNQVNLKLFDQGNLCAQGATKSCFWLNVIKEILKVKINGEFQRVANSVPTQIIFDRTELERFRTVPWWRTLNISLRVKSIVDEPPNKRQKQLASISNDEIADIIKKSRLCIEKLDANIAKLTKTKK